MNRNAWALFGGLFVVLAIQYLSFQSVRSELAALRAEVRGAQTSETSAPVSARPISTQANPAIGLQARLTNLERTVTDLVKASETLMERGVVPLNEERIAQMQQRFFDAAANDQDRLRSLRLLRRGNQMNDEVVSQAVNWLQNATNGNTRREILNQLDGVTNAALKQPLLAMLQTETAGNVREELTDVLADFAADPAVEKKLWDLALNDPNGDVREEAEEALTEGTMTSERVENLRQKAGAPDASLDERLLALRGLQEANIQAPEIVAEMAGLAQNSTDPLVRAKLFQAFDGINDQSLMAPLVNGLQDPNPVVRENAADALSSFSSDPRIQQWLNHVIQNDADPRVQREAQSALEQSQRRGRRER